MLLVLKIYNICILLLFPIFYVGYSKRMACITHSVHYCSDSTFCFLIGSMSFSDQFNDMKMAVEVQLSSALNRHQGRQLCCVKRDDFVIDYTRLLFMIPRINQIWIGIANYVIFSI